MDRTSQEATGWKFSFSSWYQHRFTIAICLVLGLSSATNVLLGKEVFQLRKIIADDRAIGTLQVGSRVPPIVGRTIDGKEAVLKYNDTNVPTVLYVFSPQCTSCRKNLNNLHALLLSTSARYRIIGISLSSKDLNQYLTAENLNFPVYTDVKEAENRYYHFGSTPETIRISPDGQVLDVWIGVYRDHVRSDIERNLGIKLPGCCADSENADKTGHAL